MSIRPTLERAPLGTPLLTGADRCDMCGARAWVRASLVAGHLHFCAHHARTHIDALRTQALSIVDERHLLDTE